MSAFRKILRIGAWLSLGIFLTLSTAFLLVWWKPGLLINTAMLKRALPWLPKSIELRWAEIDLEARSLSFFRKKVRLRGRDVCYRQSDAGVDSCFARVDVAAEIDIKGWFPKYQLGPVALDGGRVRVAPLPGAAEEAPAEPPKKGGWIPRPPRFLRDVALAPVHVELREIEFRTTEMRVTGAARLDARPDGKGSKWTLHAKAAMRRGGERNEGSADLDLESVDSLWFGPYVGNGLVRAKLSGGKSAEAKLRATPTGPSEIDYLVDAFYRERRRRIRVGIRGHGSPKEIAGTIRGEARGLVENISKVSLQKCPFRYARKPANANRADASLDCSFVVATSFPNAKNSPYARLVDSAGLRLKLAADLPAGGEEQALHGKLELLMDPLLRRVKHGRGALTTDFKGRLDDFPKNLDLDTRLVLQVPRFQKVVEMLKGFPWAVPNPLRTLDGELLLTVTSQGKPAGGEMRLPITLTTRLKSPQQKFDLDGSGELKLQDLGKTNKSHLDFRLTLSDIKLVLPYLSMKAPPRLVPDNRIRVPKPDGEPESEEGRAPAVAKKKAPAFTYRIEVATADRPVRLISNLAKSEIPVTVHVVSTQEKPIDGSIRVARFNVELFRRNASIEHFYVRLRPDPDDIDVNGEVKVVHTDYTVRILVLGQAKAPSIKFVSEPPLPERDVLAVLLFGKKIDALDTDQTQSVNSTRSAVADSAISLASMYLLASTPVESVGYDPATGVFNAKVRLADGTSLNVGSDLSHLKQVGLRKRLGGNFYLNTYVENPLESVGQKLTSFLEWSKGY